MMTDWNATSSGSGASFDEEHYSDDWVGPVEDYASEMHDDDSDSFCYPWPTTDGNEDSSFYQGDAEFDAFVVN